MTTKKIKELDIPVDKQSGSYTATMSFSTPSPGFVYVQLTDQDGNELWRELITESPVTLEAGFSHTNLTKLILNRFESNAYAVTSYIFELYRAPTMNRQEFIDEMVSRGEIDLSVFPTGELFDQWIFVGGVHLYYVAAGEYGIYMYNVNEYNPPTDPAKVMFYDFTISESVDELDSALLLARLDELYPIPGECTQNFIVYDQAGNPVSGGWTVYVTVTDPDTDAFIEEKTCVVGLDGRCSITLTEGTYIAAHAEKNGEQSTGYYFHACVDLIDLWQPVGCDTSTPNYTSGCALLLFWDKDNDGIISKDEMIDAILAFLDCDMGGPCPDPIVASENALIIDCYNNFAGIIVDMCPGCVYVIDICAWITGFGGWEAIMTSHIMDLVSGYLGVKDLGFTVTVAHIMGAVAYYTNNPDSGDDLTGCDFFP